MITRYTRPEMGAIWTDQGRLERWLEVELAATDTLAERGVVPREAAARIRERARVDAARVLEIEARVRHDVIAFTLAVGEAIGDPEAARWLHYGLTSNDVVDTAQALQVREASRLIERGTQAPRRSARKAGARISAHAADRPHARHSCRADYLRPQDRQLVRRKSPQSGALPPCRAADGRGENFRRGGQRRASGRRGGRGHLPAAGPGARAGQLRR